MPTHKLDNGFVVRTYRVPPPEFDIDRATDRERIAYGIPRCPVTFKELEERWKAKLKGFRIVEPTFKPRERRRKRLPSLRRGHMPETTNIWSGGITFPPEGDTMKWVEGTWTMPDDSPPQGAQNGIWYTASTWIGIDGDDGSSDVLQAGCDADVLTSDGRVQRQFSPWWEWWPAGSYWIPSMSVSAGDTLTCLICRSLDDASTGAIFLGNETTHIAHFFSATAPSGVSLQGNCAEWIVEALATGPGGAPELGQYNTVEFTDCNAGTAGGQTVQVGSGNTINMVDSTGTVISTGEIVGPTSVQVSYV
jgi:hypothetical protein